MNINQLLKQKREALEPKVNYPCCGTFNCDRTCDNCERCGTAMVREAELGEYFEDNPNVVEYYEETRA